MKTKNNKKQKQEEQRAKDFERVWTVCEISGALDKLYDLQFLFEDFDTGNGDAGLDLAVENLCFNVDWVLIQEESLLHYVADGLAILFDCQPKEVEKIIKRWDKLQSFV